MAKRRLYLPAFISDQNYNPTKVLPRMYFYNGVLDSEPFYFASGSSNIQLETFPVVNHYSGLTPTNQSLSLLFQNEQDAYTGIIPSSSLYTEYWETYINLLYNPKTRLINAKGIIPLADYFKIELNDIVEFRGNFYHLRAMNNYNLKTGEVDLQLLGPIIETAVTEGYECFFDFETGTYTTTTTAAPTTTTTAAPTTTTTSTTTTTTTTSTTTTTISPNYTIEFLTVGGGGGSSRNGGGGGGAGGFLSQSITAVQGNSYTIGVAGGGAGSSTTFGGNGGNSQLFPGGGTAYGGGGGGGGLTGTGPNGQDGASGGGPHRTGTIGLAIYSGQGKRGGTGVAAGGSNGGGGGGHSAIGGDANASGTAGGNGGAGTLWLDGNFYCGGGGGGAGTTGGTGGVGGGGNGGYTPSSVGMTNGSANSGGGGGGRGDGDNAAGANGGSGIVVIRYLGSQRGTGGTVISAGLYTYHYFYSSGTYIA